MLLTNRICEICDSEDLSIMHIWWHLWWQSDWHVNQDILAAFMAANWQRFQSKTFWWHLWWQFDRHINQIVARKFPKNLFQSHSNESVKASERTEFAYIANHLLVFYLITCISHSEWQHLWQHLQDLL